MPMELSNWPMDIFRRWDNTPRIQSPIRIRNKRNKFIRFLVLDGRLEGWLIVIITCRLMLSRLHGKQNLWWLTDGHWTKCVSSRRSWHIVHFSVGFGAGVAPGVPAACAGGIPSTGGGPLTAFGGGGTAPGIGGPPAWFCCWDSDDVTVVLDTWREPDERRPLDEPELNKTNFYYNWQKLLIELMVLRVQWTFILYIV